MKEKNKFHIKIFIGVICVILAVGVFIFVKVHDNNKKNYIMDVYNQFFDGKGQQYMSDEVKDSDDIQKISVDGYDVSMVSSLYDKYTGIGYFIFKVDGDIKKMKEQEDKIVRDTILADPPMYFGVSEYAGRTVGNAVGYVKGSKYMKLRCRITDLDDKDIGIELLGWNEKLYGKFDINRSNIDYVVKQLEDNDELEGYISPLGAIFSGKYSVLDKLILIYNDGIEKEEIYPFHTCFDNKRNEYLFMFSEIENIDDVKEVIMVNEKGDRDMQLKLH